MKQAALLFATLLASCSLWTAVGGRYVSDDYHYEVELPLNWRRGFSTRDGLTLTRDGLSLQLIRIIRDPFDKENPFSKRKPDKGMLPQEVAEIVIDTFRSNRNISNFQVVENSPATVGGHPGFRITYSYQTKENLRRQGVFYGVLVDQWIYRLFYEAPTRHYFQRDLSAFERVRDTFKITL